MTQKNKTTLLVLGSGPGGYSAAFRAADLGLDVTLVEYHPTLGGVCLNVGCIPSKALLHAAKVIDDAKEMAQWGIDFGAPKIDTQQLLHWKNNVVKRLTGGLDMLAKQRKVTVVRGQGTFVDPHQLRVTNDAGTSTITFDQAIIAVGSLPVKLPFLPDDPRVLDSTDALKLHKVDGRMLVIGGGIIGLEMATVYRALGCQITLVELQDQLIPGCDPDIIKPYHQLVSKQYEDILLQTKVTQVTADNKGLWVTFEGKAAPTDAQCFDQILCAVGRAPNGHQIGAEHAGVVVDEQGFIPVCQQQRTNVSHIYAIGDVVGNPMLAHKAVPEGRLAAEVIAGKKHFFNPKCIPSVAYTDPEIAWVGVTENEAKMHGIAYEAATFPWMACGRALSMNRGEGLTKILVDKDTRQVIGGCIIGVNAGELISEVSLAIEMGCDIEDIALTIHPHPTLSETVMMAAEMIEGTITDFAPVRKKS